MFNNLKQKFSKKNSYSLGFTLVELIVVITILLILGTISFLSLQGYSMNSRNGVRIADMQLIGKSFELYKLKTGKFPEPTNGIQVTYSGSEAWTQGVFGENTYKNVEKLNKIPIDPLTQNEYTYSLLNTKKEYQLASIYEGDIISYNNKIFKEIYAEGENTAVAYIKGNYNGETLVVNTGSLNYIIASPSIINSDMTLIDIQEIISQKKLSFSGYKNLPYSYKNTNFKLNGGFGYENSNIVLFKGNIDDLYNDEEKRVSYINNLKQAYSSDIFLNNEDYKQLLSLELGSLDGRKYFEEKIENQFNKNKEFIKSDIFPTKCGDENGTFEGFLSGSLIKDSCLFSSEGSSDWQVLDGIGKNNTKGLKNLASSNYSFTNLYYNVILNKPAKLNFDYKVLNKAGYVKFYINDIEYEKWVSDNSSFINYQTPLLQEGNYTFKWQVYKYSQNDYTFLSLDNILFSCIGGGNDCGLVDGTLEKGSTNPWELFTFAGAKGLAWKHVTGSGNVSGASNTYAIKNPSFAEANRNHTKNSIIYKKTFSSPAKFNFDLKSKFGEQRNYFKFYINGVEYEYGDYSSAYEGNFKTYTTPLLPAGTYEFKWTINSVYLYDAYIWLDNLKTTCVGGGGTCGIIEGSLEPGSVNSFDIFEYTGKIKTPWILVTGSGNVSGASDTYALKSPAVPVGTRPGTESDLVYKKTLTESAKLSFDLKTEFKNYYPRFRFYINGIEYEYDDLNQEKYKTYKTFTTPLLAPGEYEFKWTIKRYTTEVSISHMYIDNINFNCIGGGGICGLSEIGLEQGSTNPWDIFSYTGAVKTPWLQVTGEGNVNGNPNSYAIKSPNIATKDKYNNAQLIYNKIFTQSQKFSFDLKTDINSSRGWFKFYINGVEYEGGDQYTEYNNGFKTFTTPLLPAGTYEFKWEIENRNMNESIMWLDNFNFSCIGGGNGCGLEEGTLETGSVNPWDMFNFESVNGLPWKHVTGSGNVNGDLNTFAIKNPNFATYGRSHKKHSLVYNKTITQSAKFNFDLKSNFKYSQAYFKFYINGIEYEYGSNDSKYQGKFETFTTPLLPAGTYEFKWTINTYHIYDAYIWLDNLKFSCIGGGGTCGISEGSLEPGSNNPWDVFEYSGLINLPWLNVTGDGNVSGASNTYAIKSPVVPVGNRPGTEYSLIYRKTLTESKKFNFDMKSLINNWGWFKFYINGVEYIYGDENSEYANNFKTYTSDLLAPGTYEFKWIVRRYSDPAKNSILWLDNLRFE